jgi:protease I
MINKINRPTLKNPLQKTIVIITEKKYEDLELWYTRIRLEEEGVNVIIAAPEKIEYEGYYGLKVQPDICIKDVNSKNIDGIIIPGGYAPDFLRRYPEVLSLVHKLFKENKLVAFICHGGWVPISAEIVKGKHATGLIAIKDDLKNAGAFWEDKPVVVDQNLISSRRPDDLPCFCHSIIEFLKK